MALNPNIILSGQQPQFESFDDVRAKILRSKSMKLQTDQMQDQYNQEQAVKRAFLGATTKDEAGNISVDKNKAINSLYGENPLKAYELQKQDRAEQLAQAKAAREDQIGKLEIGRKNNEFLGGIVRGVKDQDSWNKAKEMARSVLGDEYIKQLPVSYDPSFTQTLQRANLTEKEYLDNQAKMMGLDQENYWKQKNNEIEREKLKLDSGRLDVARANSDTYTSMYGINPVNQGVGKGGSTRDMKLIQASMKLKKLGGEEKGKIGSIASGYRSLKQMEDAMARGIGPEYTDSETPVIGMFKSDNDFTSAQKILNEAFGRIQSGGAIGKQENAAFKAMGPRPSDSPEVRLKKLNNQKTFFDNKLAAYGIEPQQLADLGFDTGDTIQSNQQNPENVGSILKPINGKNQNNVSQKSDYSKMTREQKLLEIQRRGL